MKSCRRSGSDGGVRVVELRGIEKVEELCAQFEPARLFQREGLEHREIDVLCRWPLCDGKKREAIRIRDVARIACRRRKRCQRLYKVLSASGLVRVRYQNVHEMKMAAWERSFYA
jgi:hypothetical protein